MKYGLELEKLRVLIQESPEINLVWTVRDDEFPNTFTAPVEKRISREDQILILVR
jgi:hypothetical protein